MSIGKDVTIYPMARILGKEHISLGDSVIVDDFVFMYATDRISIGSFVHIAAFTCITGGGTLTLEDFVGVSGGTHIYTGSDDFLGGGLTGPTIPAPYRTVTRSFVHIKKHAIVGANSVILPGVTIGEGAAIGAGSVVTRDVQPWTVNVGSPCKPIKIRPKETILDMEARLRNELYSNGIYTPRSERKG
jgi:galactoside O-acetyltransferase